MCYFQKSDEKIDTTRIFICWLNLKLETADIFFKIFQKDTRQTGLTLSKS